MNSDKIDGRPFYYEKVSIQEPAADTKYEKILVEDTTPNQNDESESICVSEHLSDTLEALRQTTRVQNIEKEPSEVDSLDSNRSDFNENPCVIEDFVRNFLLRTSIGMR